MTILLPVPSVEQGCSQHPGWEGEEGEPLLFPTALLSSAKERARAIQARQSTTRGVSGQGRMSASLSTFSSRLGDTERLIV